MKKIKVFLPLVLCLVLLTACGGGNVRHVERRISSSELYSEVQIGEAMDEVEKFFESEYDGCKLLRLEYDEEKTREEARGWTEQCGANAIVLYSDFIVDRSGGDGSLNPDSTYRNWKWILKETQFGWALETWGYG